MKKFILLLFTFHFSLLTSFAVPAYPKAITVKQADGTALLIRLLGDEHAHIATTLDGYPVSYNPQSGNYEYATLSEGRLECSGIIATPSEQRTAEAKAFLQTIDKSAVNKCIFSARESQMQKASQRGQRRVMKMNGVPTIGTHKALVVLVNFSNAKFSMSDPVGYYDEFFHKNGFSRNGAQGCVYEWYAKGSNYNYDPEFDVYGPVTLSGTSSEYAGGVGTVMSGLQDTYKLIIEAVGLIDDEVDFSQYDTDGDGICDNVYCIYAGYGQADTQNTSTIWPHSGNLTDIAYTEKGDYSFYADGVKIDRYTVSCEMNGLTDRPAGIGTFVHEFGHVLGLADHYNSTGHQPGEWDIMADAVYNNSQNTPPLFTAFERYSLGWLQPTELTLEADTLVEVPFLEESNFAYRVSVPDKDNEYFLIENRQQKGWDKYVPGHGALVWHIDEDQSLWDANSPNYDGSHQHVDIVEADKRTSSTGKASDPFPGTAGVTSFTFNAWDKTKTFAFVHVKESGETVKFLLDDTDYKLDAPSLKMGTIEGKTAEVNWTETSLTKSYNVQLLKGDKKITSADVTALSYTFTDLEPETEYAVRVTSKNGGLSSEAVEISFTTLPLQIYEQSVEALAATDVEETSFVANWKAIDIAEKYEVQLFISESAGEKESGTGFDDYTSAESLPDGWETNSTGSPNESYYGQLAPSFRFNAEGAYLLISEVGSKLSHLRFWHRSNNAGNSVTVEELVNGEWQQVGDAIATAAGVEQTENIDLDNADAVRLVYHHKLGYFLIDDVYVTHGYSVFNPLKTVETADNFYTFTNLETEREYGYSVKAKTGDRYSGESAMVTVKVPGDNEEDGIREIENSKLKIENSPVYNLAGQRVNSSAFRNGVIIVNGRKVMK